MESDYLEMLSGVKAEIDREKLRDDFAIAICGSLFSGGWRPNDCDECANFIYAMSDALVRAKGE